MPSCVEVMTCSPDFSNPLQWLEVYGRLFDLPAELGISMLFLILIGSIYIRTHNLTLVSIATLLVVSYLATSAFIQMKETAVGVIVLVVAIIMLLFIYKLKSDITT